MNISEEQLRKDIAKLEHILMRKYNKKNYELEYIIIASYDDILKNIYGETTFVEDRIMSEDVYKIIEDLERNIIRNVCKFYNTNKDIMLNGFKSFESIFDDKEYISYLPPFEISSMSKKDFNELLLSYFSIYGDKIYNIVKKYIDEKRIELGSSMLNTTTGVFIESSCLKNGYITVDKGRRYDILTLTTLCHELGHAIDSETFLFPQSKRLISSEDIFTEVPSCFFEIGFLKYLIDSDYYSKDAHVILADTYSMGRGMMSEYRNVNALESFYLDHLGHVISANGKYVDPEGNEMDMLEDGSFPCDTANMIEAMKYSLGIYLSLNMNELCKSDREKYLKQLFNFTTSRKESDFEELINMLGISREDFESARLVKPTIDKEMELVKKITYKHV